MYKQLAVFAPLMISLIACSDNDMENTDTGPISTSEQANAAILGSWTNTFEDNGCDTTIVYTDTGDFTTKSLDEEQSGQYTLEDVDGAPGIFMLALDIQIDNGLSNCDGDSIEDIGVLETDIGFPDRNTMDWLNGDKIIVSFDRDIMTP